MADAPPPRAPQRPEQTHDAEVLQTARGPIEVMRTGSGPAVLFVHGMPGSWRQLLPLAEDLGDAHESILVSRPGYGRTPLTSGRTAVDQADLFAALLDELEIDHASVVGVSGGGPSTVAFAQRHAARARRVVLVCALAPHLMNVPRYARAAVAAPALPWLASAYDRWRASRLARDRRKLVARYRRQLSASDAALLDSDPRIVDGLSVYYGHRAQEQSWHAGMRNDVRQLLLARTPHPCDAVTSPVVVIHGDADKVVPVTHGEHHARVLDGSTLHLVPGAGHALTVFHRQRLVDLIHEHT